MFKPSGKGGAGYGAKMGGQAYPAGASKPSNTVNKMGEPSGGMVEGPKSSDKPGKK